VKPSTAIVAAAVGAVVGFLAILGDNPGWIERHPGETGALAGGVLGIAVAAVLR